MPFHVRRHGICVFLFFTLVALGCLQYFVLFKEKAPQTDRDAENSNIELVRLLHLKVKHLEATLSALKDEKGCTSIERELESLQMRFKEKEDQCKKAIEKKVPPVQIQEPQASALDLSASSASFFKSQNKRLAILVPLHRPMWQRSVQGFKNWITSYNSPACHLPSPVTKQVDLILYTNKWYGDTPEENEKKLARLVAILQEGKVDQCFNAIRFLNAGLDNQTDPERGRSNRAISEFFFSMLLNSSLTADGYDYFFHMETDTRPIRPYWIERLYEEINMRLSDFWVLGTIYRGSAHPKAFCYGKFSGCAEHMNGNAIYNLQDRNFLDWIREMHEGYVKGKEFNSWGFDTYMVNILKREANWGFLQQWAHKFIYTNLIQHGQPRPLKEVQKVYEDTYFLHQPID